MAEHQIREVETPSGNVHTTVVTDERRADSGGSAGKWLLIIGVLVLGAIAVFAFMQMSAAEAVKDNAVADAAGQVGEAAGQIGDAAGQVGEAAQDAADNLAE